MVLAGRAGAASGQSLSKKHLTFALLSCYNTILGVYRGRPRQKSKLRGMQEVHYRYPRIFSSAMDSAKLSLNVI